MVKEKISQKVRESEIEKVGIIRMNKKSLAELGIESGKSVVISKDDRSITREAIGDELVKEEEIFLRPKDREDLDVVEGDIVEIRIYKTVPDIAREKYEEVAERTKEGAGKMKEKMKEYGGKIKEKFKRKKEEEE